MLIFFVNQEVQDSITKKKNENYVNIFLVNNYFSDILNCFIYTYASLCVYMDWLNNEE